MEVEPGSVSGDSLDTATFSPRAPRADVRTLLDQFLDREGLRRDSPGALAAFLASLREKVDASERELQERRDQVYRKDKRIAALSKEQTVHRPVRPTSPKAGAVEDVEDAKGEVLEWCAQARAKRAWLSHREAAVRARAAVVAALAEDRPVTFKQAAAMSANLVSPLPPDARRAASGHCVAYLYKHMIGEDDEATGKLSMKVEALRDMWSDKIVGAWSDFPVSLARRWRGQDRLVYQAAAEDLERVAHHDPYAALRAIFRAVRRVRRHVSVGQARGGDVTHIVVGGMILVLLIQVPAQLCVHLDYIEANCKDWEEHLPALLPESWKYERAEGCQVPLAVLVLEAAVAYLLTLDGARLQAAPGSIALQDHWKKFAARRLDIPEDSAVRG